VLRFAARLMAGVSLSTSISVGCCMVLFV